MIKVYPVNLGFKKLKTFSAKVFKEKTALVIFSLFFLSNLFIYFNSNTLFASSLPLQSDSPSIFLNKQKIEFADQAIQIPAYSSFAEDQYAHWLAEDVFSGEYDKAFFKSDSQFGNFGFTQSAYWMRFDIDWKLSKVNDDLIFVVNAPTLDELSIFIQDNQGNITRKVSGYRKALSSRDINHHNYIFEVHPELGSKYLMRAKTNTALVMPLEIWQLKNFAQQNYFDIIFIGSYLGVLLVMFFYNLFIYISTRDKSYLFYILFILSYGSLQFTLDGLMGFWVYGESTLFRGYDMMIIPTLSGILSLLFSTNFLQTKTKLPRIHRVMIATIFLYICFLLISLMTNGKGIKLTAYLSLWTTFVLFSAGALALKAKQPGAQFFMFAWLFLIVGTAVYLLSIFGLFSSMMVLVYSMKTGSSIEIVLLSLGLADRMNQERRHKERLQVEKIEMESRAQMLASVDTRTGMPNRAQLQQQIDRYSQEGRNFSLVLMKVMGFKKINNTLGHENGDELLKLMALKIDSVFSDGALPSYSVGNNAEGIPSKVAVVDSLTFSAILSENDDQVLNTLALDLRNKISGTIEFKEVLLDLEVLMGITSSDAHYKNSEKFVHEAQVGMSAANKFEKKIGIYSPLIDPYSEEQLSLMGNLRKAVEQESLDLYCQPQMLLEDMSLVGFESLLRWKDNNGQFVSPNSFIPLAESCGVIRPLTRWVIRQSLLRLSELQKQVENVKVSINLSVSNLREDDLVAYIKDQIQEFAIEPGRVKFEITESSMIENEDMALNRLLQLRRLGCLISIDDYGSGYASLGYLKQLPISEVKIDRSFIMGLAESTDDQVIVKATIQMCHELGLKVVGEGVETPQVLKLLKTFKCDFGQGFLLGKPAPFSSQEVQSWIKNGQRLRISE